MFNNGADSVLQGRQVEQGGDIASFGFTFIHLYRSFEFCLRIGRSRGNILSGLCHALSYRVNNCLRRYPPCARPLVRNSPTAPRHNRKPGTTFAPADAPAVPIAPFARCPQQSGASSSRRADINSSSPASFAPAPNVRQTAPSRL